MKGSTTTVTATREGFRLEGFPAWIIWVVVGVALVFGAGFFYLANKNRERPAAVVGVSTVILLVFVFLLIGNWWGRRQAIAEVQRIQAAQLSATSSGAASNLGAQGRQATLAAPSSTLSSSGTVTAAGSQSASAPLPSAAVSARADTSSGAAIATPLITSAHVTAALVMAFALLLGVETLQFYKIRLGVSGDPRGRRTFDGPPALSPGYSAPYPRLENDVARIAGDLYLATPGGSALERFGIRVRDEAARGYLDGYTRSRMTEELRQLRNSDGALSGQIRDILDRLESALQRY